MSNRTLTGILLALTTCAAAITPVMAQYYVNPYNGYGNPYHNPITTITPIEVTLPVTRMDTFLVIITVIRHGMLAIGAGIGAAVGLLRPTTDTDTTTRKHPGAIQICVPVDFYNCNSTWRESW